MILTWIAVIAIILAGVVAYNWFNSKSNNEQRKELKHNGPTVKEVRKFK